MLSLGLCAYGAARILERQGWGWICLAAGVGLGYMVRPHVPVVVLAALAVAVVFRRRRSRPPVLGPVGRIVTIVVLTAAMAFVLGRAIDRLLPSSEATSTTGGRRRAPRSGGNRARRGRVGDRPPVAQQRRSSTRVRCSPCCSGRRSSRPDTAGNVVAAAETTLVLALCVVSWKRLRNLPAMAFRRPYVLFCLVYTGIFAFAWSSFTNLGALARQRVQVWPFVLVLLALPLVVPNTEPRGSSRSSSSQPAWPSSSRDRRRVPAADRGSADLHHRGCRTASRPSRVRYRDGRLADRTAHALLTAGLPVRRLLSAVSSDRVRGP